MPAKPGDWNALPSALNVAQVLPAKWGYCRLGGSLTTPSCSEGVWWFALEKPATASRAQIEQFARTMGCPNNRAVQPVNARVILR
jgi:carbonic anhydrase